MDIYIEKSVFLPYLWLSLFPCHMFRVCWHLQIINLNVSFQFSLSALIRPGRFDMQVTVPRPDVKGRTEILKWYLNKIKFDKCESNSLILTLLFL